MEMTDLRYPIGKFEAPKTMTAELRNALISQIAEAPLQLRQAVAGLNSQQLNTPYRDGGWTVIQVVHHLPDSHMNAYTRCKLAFTENAPTIKPYNEARWAELQDASGLDIEVSLVLLEALHRRWVVFLQSLNEHQFQCLFHHPETGVMSLDRTLALYAWHGRHHIAHITALRKRMGW
jgi:uncharacterized damage-inducible protein DinB